MRFALTGLFLLALFVALAAPAAAQDPLRLERTAVPPPSGTPRPGAMAYAGPGPVWNAPEKPWSVTLAGYAWMTSITGRNFTDGVESDIDIGFGDLFDKLEYSFQGTAEVEYRRFLFVVDSTFQRLSQDGPRIAGRLPTEISIDQTLIGFRVGYNVFCRDIGRDAWGACCYRRSLKLDAFVGARYWDVDATLSTALGPARPSLSHTETWWDPYVGARVRWPFAKRWFLNAYGDIGGFGIEDASELTWQVQAVLGFRITRGLFVAAGYRALSVDHVEGSGAGRQGIDLLFHGPAIAIGVTF